jgi:hypothetical protein
MNVCFADQRLVSHARPEGGVSVLARLVVGLLALAVVFGGLVPLSSQPSQPTHNMVIDRNLAIESGQVTPDPHEQMLSGGVLEAAREARAAHGGSGPRRASSASLPQGVRIRTLGCPKIFTGQFDNIKVNQDCSFRRKAEEFIVVDPSDPNHLIAGQNDSRIGFNHCGIDFSFDRGRHWGDQLPPFWNFILEDGHTADAGSDPALAFDHLGNAYFSCIIFDVNADANAVVVTKSNAAFGGTFFHSPAANPTLGPQAFVDNPLGVVASDNDPTIFNDKEFIFADKEHTSPKRGRVYVTWSRFRTTIQGATIESPINFSESTDGGATWSKGIEISGAASICTGANTTDPTLPANKCSRDQGSWMVIGRDGTLHVFFDNSNTPGAARQYLMVKCLGTADCTKSGNWSTPVKVADDFRTQPLFLGPQSSDPVTGCPRGRRCLPPNGYRVPDETSGSAAFDFTFGNHGRLFFAFSDFRNGGPCAGTPTTPVLPCANINNDVFVVSSDDDGATWSPAKLVSDDDKTKAAQWQPWLAVGPDGIVYIAYYDRQFGNCEATGCNDITLAASTDRGKTFHHTRITTSSMPNLVPANNPSQSGFLGDYMNVAANSDGVYIVWADTRPHSGTTPTENVLFSFVPRSTFGSVQK